jgi:hypothetical protein
MLAVIANRTTFCTSLCVALVYAASLSQQTPSTSCRISGRIELTRTDLFSVRDWKASNVSVLGFHLGKTRGQATATAVKQGLQLADYDCRGSCRGSLCDVFCKGFVWVGITLGFNSDGSVERVGVGVPPFFADPAVKEASVVRKFKGATYRFFTQYSEALRRKLMGAGVVETKTESSHRSPLKPIRYSYPARGVEVYVSRDRSSPHQLIELSISFVSPKEHARQFGCPAGHPMGERLPGIQNILPFEGTMQMRTLWIVGRILV